MLGLFLNLYGIKYTEFHIHQFRVRSVIYENTRFRRVAEMQIQKTPIVGSYDCQCHRGLNS